MFFNDTPTNEIYPLSLHHALVISPEITPEELGFQKKSLKEIAAKHNRGFYISLIDGLPIESSEKKRLLRDADIQEAEIVEDLSDEPTDIE